MLSIHRTVRYVGTLPLTNHKPTNLATNQALTNHKLPTCERAENSQPTFVEL